MITFAHVRIQLLIQTENCGIATLFGCFASDESQTTTMCKDSADREISIRVVVPTDVRVSLFSLLDSSPEILVAQAGHSEYIYMLFNTCSSTFPYDLYEWVMLNSCEQIE